jgi:hypothetical protein
MIRCEFLSLKTFIILILLVIGCASVNYVGKSYDPTNNIDVYYSEKEINKEYEVMGHAVGRGGLFVTDNQINKKLIEEAKMKGADAIIITGVGVEHVSTGDTSTEERQFKAMFIKYRSDEM